MLYLNVILTMTNPQVWKLNPEGKAAMTVISCKMMQELVSKGLLVSLESILKKGLCRSRLCLNKTELSAIMAISLRPLVMFKSDTQINLFLLHILSVPALTFHLYLLAPDSLTLMTSSLPVKDVCGFLSNDQNLLVLFNALEANYGLCLLANIVHWICLDVKNISANLAQLMVSPLNFGLLFLIFFDTENYPILP